MPRTLPMQVRISPNRGVILKRLELMAYTDEPVLVKGKVLKVNHNRVLVGPININGRAIVDYCWIDRRRKGSQIELLSDYSQKCVAYRYKKGYTLKEVPKRKDPSPCLILTEREILLSTLGL